MKTYSRSRIAIIKKREAEPWIYSYADLVTNLLAFFMMMLIVMTSSKDVKEGFVEGIQAYVEGKTAQPAKTGALTTGEVKQVLEEAVAKERLEGQVSLTENRTGIELTFEGAVVFETGSADIREAARPLLDRVATLVAKLPPRYVLDVEGHADSRPITSTSRYASNWELSSARAGSVVRYLEGAGLGSRRMRAIGYAATRPVAKSPEAEANRRVVIKVDGRSEP